MSQLKHEEQLRKIFQNVNDWLKIAEAKNLALLSFCAAVIFGLNKINTTGYPCFCTILYGFSFSIIVFSFTTAIISLVPILSKIKKNEFSKGWIYKLSNCIDKEIIFENIHYYGYLRTLDEKTFTKKYLEKVSSEDNFTPYEYELVTQILYNSRITWLKYQLFKIGAFLFSLGLFIVGILFLLSRMKLC